MSERARQFMPFDALKGFREALLEKEKIIVKEPKLSIDDFETLDYNIRQVKENMIIEIVYFDDKSYIFKEGLVSKIDFNNKYLIIVKTKIDFNKIVKIRL